MSLQKNLLILGSTGGSGICTVEQALQRGYYVTVYDRKPEKLPLALRENQNLNVLTGTLPSAPAILEPLLPKFGAIISLLGPNTMQGSGDELPKFYQWLLQQLSRLPTHQAPYLLAMGTQSISDPNDIFSLFTSVHVFFIGLIAVGARVEIKGIEKAFTDAIKTNSGLKWVIFRLNVLTNSSVKEVEKAGYVGCEGFKADLSRVSLAKWLLDEVEKPQWVGKMPAIWSEEIKT